MFTFIVLFVCLFLVAGLAIWGVGCLVASIIRFWWLWFLLFLVLAILGSH